MTSKQSDINKQLLHKLTITLIPSGIIMLALFFLLVLIFRLSNLQFISAFYILGLLALLMLSTGLLSFIKFKSYGDVNGSSFICSRPTKRDFLTRIGIAQILFGLALIIIVHTLISIIIGLVIMILAAYFLFLRK